MSLKLAELLFPDVLDTPESIKQRYPDRKPGLTVTRVAPSPTGFMHIGTVYISFITERIAHQNGGVFILRIEDTDQKRQVEGALQSILNGFDKLKINIDEGNIGPNYEDVGAYGPYMQSQRLYIYKVFAKDMVAKGFAYPCFMTEEELEQIRQIQEKNKLIPGIYGHYAKYREIDFDEAKRNIKQGKPFVIRLKSTGNIGEKIVFNDLIRQDIQTQANFIDAVLLKSDGFPTYHFAHVVDDYLMGTTIVTRGDEWIASVPLHLELFEKLGVKPPKYAHIAPILKIDDGNKRKLSKRKDPEANIKYYWENGIDPQGLLEYLANIVNSDYEDWKTKNPSSTYKDFHFKLENMNIAGALLDWQKLDFVNCQYLSKLDIQDFFEKTKDWAYEYDKKLFEYMQSYPDYTKSAMNIERGSPNDPKRFHTYKDVWKQIRVFYDSEYDIMFEQRPPFPQHLPMDNVKAFLNDYITNFDLSLPKDLWFEQLKTIAGKYGFAKNNAEFKNGGYIGKVGDAAMVLRVCLMLSYQTPDLYESMNVMGKQRVIGRIKRFL